MLVATLTFSARDWLWPAGVALAFALFLVWWSYRRASASPLRWLCAGLKVAGTWALGLCLLEPLWSGHRAQPGANIFAVVADNSRSLQVKDNGETRTRAASLKALLDPHHADWQAALEDSFEVRRFLFDTRLEPTRDFHEAAFDGRATALGSALAALKQRFEGRPLAGVLLLTDGNATDLHNAPADLAGLPPIYPVVLGRRSALSDIAISQVNVTQTAFEDAPVSIQADAVALGLTGENVVARLLDTSGREIRNAALQARKENDSLAFRFELRPEKPGVSFYRLQVGLKDEIGWTNASAVTREATLLNNSRVLAVDRGQGPYRVLYVAGRPNWEFKFLNRAIQEDPQVQLVALIRVALREGKFDFRGRGGETGNPLFRGFGNQSREEAERYDQPVLSRLNTRDELELRSGFPGTANELYGYQAVILDDVEAAFFTSDQAALLQKYVAERGGGLLMLGGMECFQQGNYQRTPIGDMLPVYLDRLADTAAPASVRLNLAREGWLQAWARLRENEADEKTRLESMPPFQVLNPVREIKPGASIVATAKDEHGKEFPAIVTQRFGRGRTAALTIGDLWRWGLLNAGTHRDLDKAWRQLVRWLVADVPRPVELTAEPVPDAGAEAVSLQVRARDSKFQPLDDSSVTIGVQAAPGSATNAATVPLRLRAEPSLKEPGVYEATYVPPGAGGYLAQAFVTNSVGLEVGRAETGWATDPAAEEFKSLQPNLTLLEDIAKRTGGELIPADNLAAFARRLPSHRAPVMEAWTTPAWHTPTVFGFALACFVAEWGLRRWKGLP
ncbi:MAG TPA: glutamine amidotransferase [Verrucomicrobiae bacterium]